MRDRAVAVVLLLVASMAPACSPGTNGVEVDRYDVTLSLEPGGSMDVIEMITVRSTGPEARLVRTVSGNNVDQITNVESTLDGTPAGEVRIEGDGGLRVDWLLNGPVSRRALMLRYRVEGALAGRMTRGLLRWAALPGDRSYPVAAVRINISIAPGGAFVAGPTVNDGAVAMTFRDNVATAELTSIPPSEPVLVSADVEFGTSLMPEPSWQTDNTQGWRLMPAFVAAGLCLVAIAGGVLFMIRLQYAPVQRKATGQPMDPEFPAVLRGLRATGVLAMVLAVVGAVVMNRMLAHLGVWPIAVPAGIFLMGVLFMVAASRWNK